MSNVFTMGKVQNPNIRITNEVLGMLLSVERSVRDVVDALVVSPGEYRN